MIKPDKHTEIKYSIVFLSAIMMREIRKNGIIKYEDLKETLIQKRGKGVNENFEKTLSFLYLLGKIIYLAESDAIKLTIE